MKTILESKLGYVLGIGAFSATFVFDHGMALPGSKAHANLRYEAYKLALALHEKFPDCGAEVFTTPTYVQGWSVTLRVNFDAEDDQEWAEMKAFLKAYTENA